MALKDSSLRLHELTVYTTDMKNASVRRTRVNGLAHDVSRFRTRNWEWATFQALLVVMDALAVGISLILAYTFRLSSGVWTYHADYSAEKYYLLVLLSIPIWLIIFYMMGLYKSDNLLGGVFEYQQMIKACVVGVVAVIIISFFWRDFALVSRGWILLSLALSIIILNVERFLLRRVGYWLRRHGWLMANTLIVGANDQGLAMAQQWVHHPESGVKVIGFLDDFKPLHMPICNGVEVLGRPSQLAEIAADWGVDEVVLVSNAVAWETFEEMIRQNNVHSPYTLRLSPGFYEILSTNVAVQNKTFVPLFTVHRDRLVGVEAFLKKLEDLAFGIPLFVLASPFFFFIALFLKWQRPDERILIKNVTLAQGDDTFTMYKFRSARDVLKSGGRPTGLERFLFHSGMDKLPQLINVLSGRMSLVGPRPQVLGHIHYDQQFIRQLQTLKPGMTGSWLVSAFWTSDDERRNELYYIRNWTIWLDFQILFQTIRLLILSLGSSRISPKRDGGEEGYHESE